MSYSECDNPDCQAAADLAVKKTFAILGVDVEKPESVEEFRADLRFGRTLRRAADKSFLTMVALVTTGLVVALWSGVVSRFTEG